MHDINSYVITVNPPPDEIDNQVNSLREELHPNDRKVSDVCPVAILDALVDVDTG